MANWAECCLECEEIEPMMKVLAKLEKEEACGQRIEGMDTYLSKIEADGDGLYSFDVKWGISTEDIKTLTCGFDYRFTIIEPGWGIYCVIVNGVEYDLSDEFANLNYDSNRNVYIHRVTGEEVYALYEHFYDLASQY